MSVKVRFAPSPTGMLHIGNVRTALITWLFARKEGGSYLLRIDDTDKERSKKEYELAIEDALVWLGLDWDDKANQSDRMDRYRTVIDQLKADGRLYACYETADELNLKRKSLLGRGKPPIYDRASLDLTDAQKQAYEAEGRQPHWRFKLNHTPITWDDRVRGEVKFEGSLLSDPVLIREDGSPLYHLCSVIDDIDFEITDVVRGEDHVSNTAMHVQMFEAMGAKAPGFAHLPLISDAEGGKLSKRLGSMSIKDLRDDENLEPTAIASLLARLGSSDPIEAFPTLQPLVDSFDFSKFSRGTPKFDTDELFRINAKILHDMPYDQAIVSLRKHGLNDVDETFWNAVRPNIERLKDVEDWWDVANGPVSPAIEDPDYISTALDLLPAEPWDGETWKNWTTAIKEKTGRKGKELFMPLRQALTGMNHGPELDVLLPLIGSAQTRKRLHKDEAA